MVASVWRSPKWAKAAVIHDRIGLFFHYKSTSWLAKKKISKHLSSNGIIYVADRVFFSFPFCQLRCLNYCLTLRDWLLSFHFSPFNLLPVITSQKQRPPHQHSYLPFFHTTNSQLKEKTLRIIWSLHMRGHTYTYHDYFSVEYERVTLCWLMKLICPPTASACWLLPITSSATHKWVTCRLPRRSYSYMCKFKKRGPVVWSSLEKGYY